MTDQIPRDVLPIPDQPVRGRAPSRRQGPGGDVSRRSSRCGRRRARRTCSSSCSTTSASARRARSAGRARRRPPSGSPASGLKYNRFHTTALCSPTRAGAAHRPQPPHGRHGRRSPSSPPRRPATARSARTPARRWRETLKLNGYSTAQFGKCHEVPVWETSPMGPFDAWPTGGGGFEYFYGFIGGETNQYYPAIYEGTTPVEPEKTPEEGYHFTEDMTDKAIELGPPAEGADARQAVLHVLRAGRDARPAPRPEGVGGQVQGPVRPGLGRAARGDLRPPEGARRRSRRTPS